ncbi:MAG: hypothetical protein ACQEVA_06110 [Myxococcota bacterium]
MRHTGNFYPLLCLIVCALLPGCDDLLGDRGVLTLGSGERVNADEIPRNARPELDPSVLRVIYEGSEITPILYETYSDEAAFYLLLQVDRGWDKDLNLQERQPIELRKFVGYDDPAEVIALPRNIEPLGDDLGGGCSFVDTTEVGTIAIKCNGEIAVRAADAADWMYLANPDEGPITYASQRSLYYEVDPQFASEYPVAHVDGRRIALAEPPAALGQVEDHWIGPWDGERARILYKPDLRRLCAAVWTLTDGSVREDGCLEFDVPGAEPLSAGHIGGSVDQTVFFGGGETNTVERGANFWATIRPGQIDIVGRTSDRGNTIITINEDLGGPHIDDYFTTTVVKVGTGAGAQDLEFFEIFDVDGGYDFTTDVFDTFNTGNPADICPKGEALTKCRTFSDAELFPLTVTRVSMRSTWRVLNTTYDARRRLLIQRLDVPLGSERDTSTTADPNRVIDEYVPLSPVVSMPVWAKNVPGSFTDNVPSYADLSECASVTNQDGVEIERDELQSFPIDIFDTHTIELQGCQPEDAGPPLLPVSVEAPALVDTPYLNPDTPNAWNMEGVVFGRGQLLPISEDNPEVVGGADGAMVISTNDGWSLIEAASPSASGWTRTEIAPVGTAAPRFVGNRRYVVVDGGAVYGRDEATDVTAMAGVGDPADLQSVAHGQLLALDTPQVTRIWSTENGAPSLLLDRNTTNVFLDASDDAGFLLEQDGGIVRVTQTDTGRGVDLVALGSDTLRSAEMSADGSRVLLWTLATSARPTATLYSISAPTQTQWPVTSTVITTLNSPHRFRRSTGEVFYQNDVGPGEPDYRAFMIYTTDGQRVVATQDSIREVFEDNQGNLLWFDFRSVLRRMNWSERVVEDVPLPSQPTGNIDPGFYTRDGFVEAVAIGDWYLYGQNGELERVSAGGFTFPVSGLRGVELAASESSQHGGNAISVGERGPDVSLVDTYEVGLFDNFIDQVSAFNLAFSAREEDGAFLRAPCVPYRLEGPQADYVTTSLDTWFCAR